MKTRNNRKKNIPVKYLNMYKQFKIFYGNMYGKIGLIILMGFVIITLLTPIIVIQPNYSALAPVVDASSPSIVYSTNLVSNSNFTSNLSSLYFLTSSDTTSGGANQLLFGSENGTLYSQCINSPNLLENNKIYKVYETSRNNPAHLSYTPILSTFQDCTYLSKGVLDLVNFVFLPMSNGNITVGEVSSTTSGQIHPVFKQLYNVTYKGSLISNLTTNALPYIYNLYNNPSFYYEGIGATSQAEFFFVSEHNEKRTLDDYSVLPNKLMWNTSIPLQGNLGISFLGSGFNVNQYTNHSEVLVYNKTTIYSFDSMNGTFLWRTNVGLDINVNIGLNVPSAQEQEYDGNNYGFLINSVNSLYKINLVKGNISKIYTANSTVNTLTTTAGHGSFPSAVILSTSNNFIILHMNSKGKIYSVKATIPILAGKIDNKGTYSEAYNMVFVSQKGYVLSVNTSATSTKGAYLWSLVLVPGATSFTAPNLILNGYSGDLEIGIISNVGYYYLISATPIDHNPISPTLTSPSGESFPLGTEFKGYNVWSWLIGSFYVDWEFGIIIGLYTMGLALLVGMYVGYKGGISGGIIETVALGIYLTPSLGLLIALTDFFPPDQRFIDIILVIGGLGWPFAAFTLMGIVKSVRSRTYIEASKMLGSGTFTILRKDILPNLGPLLLYMLSLSIAGGAGAVSSLQFLGIARITVPTWGGMLSEVLDNFYYTLSAPFWIYPPVIALTMFVFSFILISRGMDELSNPRLRRRQ